MMTALEASNTRIPLPIPPNSSISPTTATHQPSTDSPAALNMTGGRDSLYAALDSITAPTLELPPAPAPAPVSESVVLCVEEGETALVPGEQDEGLFSLCNIL